MIPSLICCVSLALGGLPGAESYLAGAKAEKARQFRDASEAFAACSAADPALAPYAAIRAARCRELGGDPEGAAAAYRVIVESDNAGPWTEMARAYWADLLHGQGAATAARVQYEALLAGEPRPRWMDAYAWRWAEGLMADEATRPEAFAWYRDQVTTAIYLQPRLDAARKLLESPAAEDRSAAILGLVRSGMLDEAGKAFAAENGADVMTNLLAKVLAPAPKEEAGNLYMRLLLAYAVRKQAAASNWESAETLAIHFVSSYPESREAGEALYYVARRLEGKDKDAEAAKLYASLSETCPKHYQADDGLMDAARLWRELGEAKKAVEARERLIKKFPDSALLTEAHYALAEAALAAKETKRAQKHFAAAAEKGALGNFYAHRAQGRIGGKAPAIDIAINTESAVLRALDGKKPASAQWDDALAKDPRVERMRFFGAHGLDAGQWEALALLRSADGKTAPALYRAAAEAGYAYTAQRFSWSHKWKGLDSTRLSYPLAYWPQVTKTAKANAIDPFLLLALAKQESVFQSAIRSSAGATGVMQLMPATAEWLAEIESALTAEDAQNLESPEHSLRIGAAYLSRMLERSNGSLILALAAYNGGPGNCDKWRKRYPNHGADAFIEAIPFAETRGYVKKVLGNYAAYKSLYAAPAL